MFIKISIRPKLKRVSLISLGLKPPLILILNLLYYKRINIKINIIYILLFIY
jgi:hypothetical protein